MLRFMDGFGHYSTAQIPLKWTAVSGGVSIATNGRRASNCANFFDINVSSYLSKTIDTQGTWIIGFAYRKKDVCEYSFYLKLFDGSTEQVQLKFTDTDISVWSNGEQLGSTAEDVLTLSQFYYVEAKFIIHETEGRVIVNVSQTIDGIYEVVQAIDTGLCCTQVSDNAYSNIFRFESEKEARIYVDDVKVFDGTGDFNNDFVGDQRIDMLAPRANGTYSQFSIISPVAVDHYTVLDEETPSTTDFVRDCTEDHKDTFYMTELPYETIDEIYGVQPIAYGDSIAYPLNNVTELWNGWDTSPDTSTLSPSNGTKYFNPYASMGIDLGLPVKVEKLYLSVNINAEVYGFWDVNSDTLVVYASNDNANWWWVQTFNGKTGQIICSGASFTLNLSSAPTARYFKIRNPEQNNIRCGPPSYEYYACYVISAYRLSGLSKAGIKFMYRMNDSDYNADGTGTALGATAAFVSTITEKNPRTGATWTKAEIAAMEAGFAMIGTNY